MINLYLAIVGAALCGASFLCTYCIWQWRKAETLAQRWYDAAQAYAALARRNQPALTQVAPVYHAPWAGVDQLARTRIRR